MQVFFHQQYHNLTSLNWNLLESRGIPYVNVNYLLLNPSRWWYFLQCHILRKTPPLHDLHCFSSSFHMSPRWTKGNFFKKKSGYRNGHFSEKHMMIHTQKGSPMWPTHGFVVAIIRTQWLILASSGLIASVRFCPQGKSSGQGLKRILAWCAYMYHIWENICVNAGRDTHLHHLQCLWNSPSLFSYPIIPFFYHIPSYLSIHLRVIACMMFCEQLPLLTYLCYVCPGCGVVSLLTICLSLSTYLYLKTYWSQRLNLEDI